MNSLEMAKLIVNGNMGYDTSADTDIRFMATAYIDLVNACKNVTDPAQSDLLWVAMDNDPLNKATS